MSNESNDGSLVFVYVSLPDLQRIYRALSFSHENAHQLLLDHESRFGDETRRNSFIADGYRKDLVEIEGVLDLLMPFILEETDDFE